MTNNDLYQQLISNGAPELPDRYFYKFWIAPKEMRYRYIKSNEEMPESQGLHVALRKKVFAGLFYKTICIQYLPQRTLHSPWAVDNANLIDRGWIKEEDIRGRWLPAHLALLAEEANDRRIYLQMEEARLKAQKAKEKKSPPRGPEYGIAHYLNKRLP